MILAELIIGAPRWVGWAAALGIIAAVVVVWSYLHVQSSTKLRVACGMLKAAGFALIAICLLEPLYNGERPTPGSNLFLVVADNSRSLQLADSGRRQTRGETLQAWLAEESPWLARLQQDFDVRKYVFDTTLRPVKNFAGLTIDGNASAVAGSLRSLAERFHGKPIAGILLLTDGNATDLADQNVQWKQLPPVYAVALASESEMPDLSVSQLSVTQTNFEASPVTLTADIDVHNLADRNVVLRVLDQAGKEIDRRKVPAASDRKTLTERFLIKPEQPGISFYSVAASIAGEEDAAADAISAEATLANNRRIATVDRGGGPYRVLYVGGRPNWDFKFLRRALEEDDEVKLVSLVRVAKKEPKFTFLGRAGERTNPLFRGFGNDADEEAETYDQPVLLRLGTEDQDELRGGFPKDAEDLFRFHAVILEDVEAAFFSQDQMSLLQQFVSQRGGGLLMLGGKDSFAEGGYDRTPVGEMLPVYLDRLSPLASEGGYRLRLTREGRLEPWIRVRATEPEEDQRLAAMPAFHTLNRIDAIKPGASVLAELESPSGEAWPSMVMQPFGRGRVAAQLAGDLWRWNMRRPKADESDLERSWRQTIRWLVADVPKSLETEVRPVRDGAAQSIEVVARVRDKLFAPLDNADVKLTVKTPDNRQIALVAESSDRAAGEYRATFAPRVAGAYRAQVTATAADGSSIADREVGWAVEPESDEFRHLSGNRALLDRITSDTGGEVIEGDELDEFVSSLPNRKIPVVENWTYPIWHQWNVLALAIACLVGEWGLRRWRGLP